MAAGHIDYISCKSFDDTAVRILADNRFFSVIRFLGPSCEVQPVPVSEAESFGITDGETAFVGPDHLKVVLRSLPGDHQGRAVQEKVIAVVCFGKRHGGSLFYAAKIAIVLEHPYQGLLEIYQEYAYVPAQKKRRAEILSICSGDRLQHHAVRVTDEDKAVAFDGQALAEKFFGLKKISVAAIAFPDNK